MEINVSEIPPLSTVMVIAGIIFLLLGIAKSVGGKITISPRRQNISAFIGAVLIIAGIGLYFFPSFPTSQTNAVTGTPIETATVSPITQSTVTYTLDNLTPTQSILTSSQTPGPTVKTVKGFQDGCIDSNTWLLPRDETRKPDDNNCWPLSDWGMIAEKDIGLSIFVTKPNALISKAIFTPIGKNAEIKFSINIDELFTSSNLNAYIAFGLSPANSDTIHLEGLLYLFQTEEPNKPIWLKLKEPGKSQTYLPPPAIKLHQFYEIKIDLVEGNRLFVYLDEDKVDERNLPESYSYFLLSFNVPNNAGLSALIPKINLTTEK